MNVPSSNESLFCFPPPPPPPPPLLQVRCCQYWPEQGTSKEYGKFQVFSQIEQVDRVYVTRRFKLRNNQVHIVLSVSPAVYQYICLSVCLSHARKCLHMRKCLHVLLGIQEMCVLKRDMFSCSLTPAPKLCPPSPTYMYMYAYIHCIRIYGHICARWYL